MIKHSDIRHVIEALFQNLYDFYAQYVDSPYITLVSSDLTAMRTADHIVGASQPKEVLRLRRMSQQP